MSNIRFLAPPHISAAFLSRGPVAVIDGAIELVGDVAHGDWAGLIASGFELASAIVAKAPAAKPEAALQKAD